MNNEAVNYTPPHHLVDTRGISYEWFGRESILGSARSLSNTTGRHAAITADLGNHLSDFSLQRERVRIMVLHLIAFSGLKETPLNLSEDEQGIMLSIAEDFSDEDYVAIFQYDHLGRNGQPPLEHDVKAVELFLGEKLSERGLSRVVPFVHILCTSEDVNNLAYQVSLRDTMECVILPKLRGIIQPLVALADAHKSDAILGRTHGQQAVPTTFGKLIATELENLATALEPLEHLVFSGKFSGATGSNAAHMTAFPKVDWIEYERRMVEQFGFRAKACSDQRGPLIERVQLFHLLADVNNVLMNLSGKLWDLCGRGVLVQQSVAGEAGSSVMPGKTNPWRLEEAKWVFLLANKTFSAYTENHPITHRERDLSEHPMERNYGEPFGQMLIGLTNFLEQLGRIAFSQENADEELDNNPEILGEAIQSNMRAKGIPRAYDFLALFMKGRNVTTEDIQCFMSVLSASSVVDKHDIILSRKGAVFEMFDDMDADTRGQFLDIILDEETSKSLMKLSPKTYIGDCARRTENGSRVLTSLMGEIDTRVMLCRNRPRLLAVGFDFDDTLYIGDKEELRARVDFISDRASFGLTEEQKAHICSFARWDEQKACIIEYARQNGADVSNADALIEALQEEAKPEFAHMLRMEEWSMETLGLLKRKWVPAFLITNRGPKTLGAAFEKYRLAPYFAHVVDSSHSLKKPDPELMHEALLALGIKHPRPESVVYVGDNMENDVTFALRSDVTPVFVDRKGASVSMGIQTVWNMTEYFRTLSLQLL